MDKTNKRKQITSKKIESLKSSPNVNRISFVSNSYSRFMVQRGGKKVTYRGLVPVLKEKFYPEVEEDPRKNKNKRQKTQHEKYIPKMKSECEKSSKEHGDLVHNQVQQYVSLLKKRSSLETIKDVVADFDKCSNRVIALLHQKGWTPVFSEYPLFFDDVGVATKADLIVYEKSTGKLILIELKNGYEDEEYGPVEGDKIYDMPSFEIRDCPKNRHFLQLMCTGMMMDKTFHANPDKSYIVRCRPKMRDIECIEAPKWIKSRELKAYLMHVFSK